MINPFKRIDLSKMTVKELQEFTRKANKQAIVMFIIALFCFMITAILWTIKP